MSGERWTRYALFPRRGWTAMQVNLEEPVDAMGEAGELDSRWVRNDLAAGAHGDPVWLPLYHPDSYVRLDRVVAMRAVTIDGEPDLCHLYVWTADAPAQKQLVTGGTHLECRSLLDQLRGITRGAD